MNRCEDCIHFEMCNALEQNADIQTINPAMCSFFKHKKSVVYLPCKLGDTVWIVRKSSAEPFPAKFDYDDIKGLGKTVFMTKAEAMKRMGRKR